MSFRLIYRSRSQMPAEHRRTDLGDLFSVARSNNKKLGVTGALLIYENWFCQILEGEEAKVRDLFGTIEKDPRHDRITVVHAGESDHPVFGRWAMARVSEDGHPDIPLIAHQDGISPAARRGTTPEQEMLLDMMRDGTRAAAENEAAEHA